MKCDNCRYTKMCVRRLHPMGDTFNCKHYEEYEPRPHGEWKEFTVSTYRGTDEWGEPKWGKGKKFICKRCGRRTVIRENFCPNCGSDNRRRENNSSSMIINGKYSENVEYGTRIEIRRKRR